MTSTWIVAADAGRARIFADHGKHLALEEIDDMVNTAQRMRISDKMTDRLGPTSAGQSIHNTGGAAPNKQYEPPQTQDEHDAELFARDLSSRLLQARQQGQFDQLVIAAAPRMLGLLRKLMDARVQAVITREIDKDYSRLDPIRLRDQIGPLHEGPA
jgi:protein required for attachment to host cells